MQRVFETFLERLSESVDDIDLKIAMAAAVATLDLPMFAYFSLPPNIAGEPRLISNYSSRWTSYYLRRQYEKIDPVVLRAVCGKCPFRWGRGCFRKNFSTAQQRLFDEAAEFGIVSGLTIPIYDRLGNFAALTFAADERDPLFLRAAERYELALRLMATCFHIEARRMLAGDLVVDGVKLTPREFECLRWAVGGKSARDIGAILGISQRTATFHLDNAKAKLGVRTRAQAIARFSANGPARR